MVINNVRALAKHDGQIYYPTILTDGPVVVVEAVDTPEEAPKVLAGIVNVNSPTVNDEIHAPMGGVRDSGWGRTGPRSLDDFSDLIWINSHSGQRQYPC
jgi:hypothetical protein